VSAWHVVPALDEVAHDVDGHCVCGPELDGALVVHHALDARGPAPLEPDMLVVSPRGYDAALGGQLMISAAEAEAALERVLKRELPKAAAAARRAERPRLDAWRCAALAFLSAGLLDWPAWAVFTTPRLVAVAAMEAHLWRIRRRSTVQLDVIPVTGHSRSQRGERRS